VANKLPSVWEIIACVQPNKVGKIDRRMEKSEKGGAVGENGRKTTHRNRRQIMNLSRHINKLEILEDTPMTREHLRNPCLVISL